MCPLTFILGFIGGLFVMYMKTLTPNDTEWKECTYCDDCEAVYDNSSIFNHTRFMCPKCGKNTKTLMSYGYKDGKLEVKKR